MTGRPFEIGERTKEILATLAECPMTAAELEEALGVRPCVLAGNLRRLRKPKPGKPKQVYIVRYELLVEGQKRYPRPVYAVGDLPDARKPRPLPKGEAVRQYRQRSHKLAINSVFKLGMHKEDAEKAAIRIRKV